MTDTNREQFKELVDTFGKGWTEGDIEVLLSTFAEDAVFLETPFSESASGRDAVREFWEGVRVNHADVKFRAGEIYVAGPWFATEFRCTFRRRRTGEAVDARGAMFCETKEGLIAEMRMYWHRMSGGRDTSKP